MTLLPTLSPAPLLIMAPISLKYHQCHECSLFLEDLPGKSEALASPSIFYSADDGSGIHPSVIRAEDKVFLCMLKLLFKQCLGDMSRKLTAGLF